MNQYAPGLAFSMQLVRDAAASVEHDSVLLLISTGEKI